MGSVALQDTEFRYRAVAGNWVATRLGEADAAEVVRGLPVREFPTYQGQRNYPGWLWLSTELRTENQELRRRLEIAHGQLRPKVSDAPGNRSQDEQ